MLTPKKNSAISSDIWKVLTCSYCGDKLERTNTGAECHNCGLEYPYTLSGSLDLRLRKRRKYGLEFELGTSLPTDIGSEIEPLRRNTKPEVDFSDMRVPRHLSKDILSYFPKAKSPDSLMLDLGCGGAIHKGVCERAGFQWVGLDPDPLSNALILGDAHSLPFKECTFEFILSIAVLQYSRFPFVMMREAYRVLKSHGRFIGTVAFLEPFHGTFYHHTHLGTLNSLHYGGFTVEKLAPSRKWSVLVAQAHMGLFPRMPRFLSQSIVYPIQLLHRLWWQAGHLVSPNSNECTRIRNTTGAFTFIAVKGDA
jgi:SAM-dependent methyltransferase